MAQGEFVLTQAMLDRSHSSVLAVLQDFAPDGVRLTKIKILMDEVSYSWRVALCFTLKKEAYHKEHCVSAPAKSAFQGYSSVCFPYEALIAKLGLVA